MSWRADPRLQNTQLYLGVNIHAIVSTETDEILSLITDEPGN